MIIEIENQKRQESIQRLLEATKHLPISVIKTKEEIEEWLNEEDY